MMMKQDVMMQDVVEQMVLQTKYSNSLARGTTRLFGTLHRNIRASTISRPAGSVCVVECGL